MERLNLFDKSLDIFSKSLSLLFKIAVLLGGGCFLGYSLKIGSFPEGITVGDGLTFIFVFLCFGFLYLLFVGSITALGLGLRPVWKCIQCVVIALAKLRKKYRNNPPEALEFAKADRSTLLFVIFGLIGLYYFSSKNFIYFFTLLVTSGLEAFVFATYLFLTRKIGEVRKGIDSKLKPEGFDEEKECERLRQIRLTSYLIIFAGILYPAFASGVFGDLLVSSMRMASLRKESVSVYVKAPFAKVVEAELGGFPESSLGKEYIRLENVDILLSGLGKNVVFEILKDGKAYKFSFPAESVITQ